VTDPLERAAAKAPPIIGGGCTQRYDPEALSPEQGAEFADAAALWARMQGGKARLEAAPFGQAAGESGPGGLDGHDTEAG